MRNIKILIVMMCFSINAFSFSLSDIDKIDNIDKQDRTNYIEKAKNKAKKNKFKESYKLLEKASSLGLTTNEYKNTKNYIAQKEKAYKAKLERQKKERERLASIERERQNSYSSSTSSGSSLNSVAVSAECSSPICTIEKFSISGSPGYISHGYNLGIISKGYNGALAGRYSFSAVVGSSKKYCGGSFYVSGNKANVKVNIFEHNCSFNTYEY